MDDGIAARHQIRRSGRAGYLRAHGYQGHDAAGLQQQSGLARSYFYRHIAEYGRRGAGPQARQAAWRGPCAGAFGGGVQSLYPGAGHYRLAVYSEVRHRVGADLRRDFVLHFFRSGSRSGRGPLDCRLCGLDKLAHLYLSLSELGLPVRALRGGKRNG